MAWDLGMQHCQQSAVLPVRLTRAILVMASAHVPF